MLAMKDRPARYQDVLDAPEGMRAEILDGELVMQARPMPAHDFALAGMVSVLHAAFQRGIGGPGGWWIVAEPELHFGDRNHRTLVPDLAGWRKARMPVIDPAARYPVVPDWVCEILSPSTARTDRMLKMPIYAEVGVAHLWLADPVSRLLEIYELVDGRWTLAGAFGDEGEAGAMPFADIPLPLDALWLPVAETAEGAEPEAGA